MKKGLPSTCSSGYPFTVTIRLGIPERGIRSGVPATLRVYTTPARASKARIMTSGRLPCIFFRFRVFVVGHAARPPFLLWPTQHYLFGKRSVNTIRAIWDGDQEVALLRAFALELGLATAGSLL